MTQVPGTTPGVVQLRGSKTPGAVPSGLADGELGIQQADHLAYYNDAAGNLCAFALNLATKVPVLSSGAYTTTTTDALKVLAVTTGASNAVVTLVSAAAAGDGAVQQITKADGGAGIVQVSDNASGTFNAASAWLFTKGDVVFLRSDGTAWSVYRFKIAPWRQVFNASTSTGCVVPPLFTSVDVTAFTGGQGGTSGDRKATTVARGGTVGSVVAGAIVRRLNGVDVLAAYPIGAAIFITVGAGGAGAAGATADNTASFAGTYGGPSYFGTLLDTNNANALGYTTALTGTGGSTASVAANSTTSVAGRSGNIPADITSSGFSQAQAGNGSGGTTSGTAPTAGTVAPARPSLGGSGGGSGAYISGQAGQNGAAGGTPGGGGGGGSPSDNGFASGAGGQGGGGQVRATWNFGE